MGLTASGDLGIVKVGYQRAVTIVRWSLNCPKDTTGEVVSTIEAKVDSANDCWANIAPTAIGLWMNTVWWVWYRVTIQEAVVRGRRVTYTIVGDPEVRVNF